MAYRKELPPVGSATNLPASAKGDQSDRMRKYLISMTFRTVCFVLAVVFTGPLRWIFIVLAVILPYIAVVIANASNSKRIDVLGVVRPEDQIKVLQPGHPTP